MGVNLGGKQGVKWNHRAAKLTFRLLNKLFTPFFHCLKVTEVYQLKLKFPRFDLLPKDEVSLSFFFF